ncbi:polysaccharide pyruvyl transferase family protein [Intrasporangium calvum]|uniref:polysaccharide pyruvyl transferase family protein n=1 Tax=Intrasporangium calvum TaxID=53358 RepID=UPI000DF5E082|nr:polysaccharide pyruvyl transferase family protein [Intrasporangium calvum]AXG12823.1 hypothetical protein DN585_04755 [Intrasporangium calvum]
MRGCRPDPGDAAVLAALRAAFDEALGAALDGRSRAVVLDAPDYRNAGDLLILRGALDSLGRLGVHIRLLQDRRLTSWETLRRLPSSVAVLLHGGGNLGGLYPVHDEYRGRVFETVPDSSRVVLLPQSVSFPDRPAELAARQRYGRFPQATYLIRDTRSLQRLGDAVPELGAGLRLAPDAAFGTTLARRGPPSHDLLVLQRSDKESTGLDLAEPAVGLDFRQTDWPSFGQAQPAFRAIRRLARLYGSADVLPSGPETAVNGRWARASRRLQEGLWAVPQRALLRRHTADHVRVIEETLSDGRVIVTDRLHAHIGAALLGIPSVALDNLDGKVSALIQDWTAPLSTTHRAGSAAEALTIARSLLPTI